MRVKVVYRKGQYTELVCLECGDVFPIYRRNGRAKQVGHIKHLYCPICLKETAHYEVKDADVFLWKYEYADFEDVCEEAKLAVDLLVERKKKLVRKRD